LLAISVIVNIALLSVGLAVALLAPRGGAAFLYTLIVSLAVAMGLQNAVARKLAVPDMTTTVLTLTLTGIAADSALAGGKNPHTGRRIMAALVMFLGAAIGAILIFKTGVVSVLMLAIFLLFVIAFTACRAASSTAAWTAGT
jgi:uncharacterized membrane protein YoaK (UPF0700 family)